MDDSKTMNVTSGKLTNGTVIAIFAVISVFVAMYGFNPYATGYMHERTTLWQDMLNGYKLDGGEWSFGYFVPIAVLAVGFIKRRELARIEVNSSLLLGGALLRRASHYRVYGGIRPRSPQPFL